MFSRTTKKVVETLGPKGTAAFVTASVFAAGFCAGLFDKKEKNSQSDVAVKYNDNGGDRHRPSIHNF